jgi:branched-chain amino acid transport system ATP-binding protein
MLEVFNITTGYSGRKVLTGVSFTVSAGEVLGVFGNNGTGKSTLFKALAGFRPTSTGRIILEGRSIEDLAPYHRARAGLIYIPQDDRVFSSLNVEDNLTVPMLGNSSRDVINNHVSESCRRWPWLSSVLGTPAGLLSGGQKLVVAVARASSLRGKCYLLDEPFAGIDPTSREMISDLIDEFSAQGCAVLIAEQNLDIATEFAERALVLSPGGSVLLPSCSKLTILETMRQLS